jgi:hypothetical protein
MPDDQDMKDITMVRTSADALLLPPLMPALSDLHVSRRGLAEHSATALQQAGIGRILILPGVNLDRGAAERLAAAGLTIEVASDRVLETLPPHRGLVVLSVDVFFDRGAIAALFDRMSALNLEGAAAAESSPGTLAAVSATTADEWRHLDRQDLIARVGALRALRLGESRCSVALSVNEARVAHRQYTAASARQWWRHRIDLPARAADRLVGQSSGTSALKTAARS